MASDSGSGKSQGARRTPAPIQIDIPKNTREQVVMSDGRETERTIKARSDLLFEDDEDAPLLDAGSALEPVETKPFLVYLRTTPAEPLSGGMKVFLYGAGVVVLLLLVAALMKQG